MEPPPSRTYPASPELIRRHCRNEYATARRFVEERIASFIEHT